MGIPLMPAASSRRRRVRRAEGRHRQPGVREEVQPGRQPVGKRFGHRRADAKLDIEIVGIVQDAKYSDVKREVPPQYFLPYRQEERLGTPTSTSAPRRRPSRCWAPFPP